MLGLHDLAGHSLQDTRRGKKGSHTLIGLLRQSAFGRLAGYPDVNDAERLVRDPVMRQIVGGRAVDGLTGGMTLLRQSGSHWTWTGPSAPHGDQKGTAWNGHFGCKCHHPLFVFNQSGDLERCALRKGNVHSADGWKEVLASVIARYKGRDLMRFFRADATFALPELYKMLEAEGYFHTIRLKGNNVLQEAVAHLLKRPVGRPSNTVRRFYHDVEYQAASWDNPCRVVAKVEWPPGELFPRVGFIVTNLPMDPEWVMRFYNQRGTAEQHIKEGKHAINWTRLSCKRFRDNEVRLQLHALAYNLGGFLGRAELPEEIADWSPDQHSKSPCQNWRAWCASCPCHPLPTG